MAPLSDNDLLKDFLICVILGGLLFLVSWGAAHWIILIVVAVVTGVLGAMTSQ